MGQWKGGTDVLPWSACGPAVVVMLNSGIAGDAPGRCEICGFLTSGFCPYCGCEVNSFIIFFVAVKLF